MEIQRVVAALSVLLAAVAPAVDAADCPDGGAEFGFRLPRLLVFPGEPAGFASVGFGDLDADGVPEAVAAFLGDPATVRTYRVGANLALEELSRAEIPEAGDVLVADVTGDGVADTIVQGCSENDCAWIRLSVLEGDGSGGMRFLASVRSYGGASVARRLTSGQVVVEDLDGDGHPDVVLSVPSLAVFWGPDFAAPQFPTRAGASRGGVARVDANGDELGDLLFACDFAAVLGVQVEPRVWSAIRLDVRLDGPVFATDLEGHGATEVVCRTLDGILRFRADDLQDPLLAGELLAPAPPSLTDYEMADLDGDGVPDLMLLFESKTLEIRYGARDADGFRLEETATRAEAPGSTPPDLGLVDDVDGDGRPDVVLGRACILGGAKRAFDLPREISPLAGAALATGDVDGDGWDDVVCSAGDVLVLRFGGPGPDLGPARSLADLAVPARRVWVVPRSSRDDALVAWSDIGGLHAIRVDAEGAATTLGYVLIHRYETVVGFSAADGAGDPHRIALVRQPDTGGPARLVIQATLDFRSASEPWSRRLPGTVAGAEFVDADRDGFEDLVLSSAAWFCRGGPGGPVVSSEEVVLEWDGVSVLTAIDLDGDSRDELAIAGRKPGFPSSSPSISLLSRSPGGSWTEGHLLSMNAGAMTAIDLDADGDQDLVALGAANEGFEVLRNDGDDSLHPWFAIPPGSGGSMCVADLDRDGAPDLVGASGDRLLVAHGAADSMFEAPAYLWTKAGRIRAGDPNSDGRPDFLVLRNFEAARLALSTPGGGYDEPIAIPAATAFTDNYSFGDFDGDGREDLTFDEEGTSYFLPGAGDGSFLDPVSLGPPNLNRIAAGAGDLDGDGLDDLLLIDPSVETVEVRWGSPAFATGTSTTLPGAHYARRAEVVDVNGDLLADIVGFEPATWGATRAFVLPGAGGRSFLAPIEMHGVCGADEVLRLIRDLDGDGRMETLVRVDASWWLVRIEATFDVVPISVVPLSASGIPRAFADVDGDGRLDLLSSADSDLVVMLGEAGGDLSAPVRFAIGAPAWIGRVDDDAIDDVLFSSRDVMYAFLGSGGRILRATRSYPRPDLREVLAHDLDGDGWDELLVVAGRSPPGIEFVRGGPDRVLEVLATVPVPEPAGGWGRTSVAVRDLDGDGLADIACLAGASLYWLRGTGPFTFEPTISIAGGLAGDDISFHDLDRDGDDDLLIEGFAVLMSLGGASFAAPRRHPVAGWGDDTAFGDFDGDGLLDAAAIVGTGDAAVLFFHGTADGRFEAAEGLFAPEASGTAVAGNFHGTERLDIAVAGRSDQRYSATRVYEMLPNGSLAPGPVLDDPISTLKGARALAAADLDGDGVVDLLEAHEEGHVTVRLGGPDGPGEAILVTHGPSTPAQVVAANVVGSGAQDLITVGRNGAFHGAGWRHDACFRRGDSDADGRLTIGDPIRVLGWLFLGETSLPCQDAADVDDDGTLRIGDAIVALGWLFLGAEAPPPPFEACGTDPSPDELGCESFVPCA